MHDLLVRAFPRAAADSVTQAQVLVIAHASRIFAVIADQRIQTLAPLWRLRPQTLQPRNHSLDLAVFEITGNLVHPLVGLARSFAVAQARELPGMLQSVPEIQNLA